VATGEPEADVFSELVACGLQATTIKMASAHRHRVNFFMTSSQG
jgi:hypothetical protein